MIGGMRRRLPRYGLLAVGGYLGVAFLGRGLFPLAIQKFVVAPTELTRETPYLRHHIAATRQAWGLDSVEIRELAARPASPWPTSGPTARPSRTCGCGTGSRCCRPSGSSRRSAPTTTSSRWTTTATGSTASYRQVLLSPRELNPASLPTRTFINEHLTFTHGMGLTLSPVNQVTAEGLPVLFIKDLPPVSNVSLRVTRPQIYYGEIANEYVFVGTRQREFDHPSGEANVYAAYSGTGGVRVGNLWRRLLLAVRFGSSKILLSQDITNDSRVLYHRNIAGPGEEGAAVPPVRSRPVPGDRGRRHAASGSSTPTPRPTAIPTRSGCSTAPATCGTASSWSSMPTTAR